MKKVIKLGIFILVVSLSSMACGPKKASDQDTDNMENTDTLAVKPLDKDAKVDPTTGCD